MIPRPRSLPFLVLLALSALGGCAAEPEAAAFPDVTLFDPPNDTGESIQVRFTVTATEALEYEGFRVERASTQDGPFRTAGILDRESAEPGKDQRVLLVFTDDSPTPDTMKPVAGKQLYYRVVAFGVGMPEKSSAVIGPFAATADWWNVKKLSVFLALIAFSALVMYFIRAAKKNPDIYVRPIGGLSAISEAIGRATEMGRPVLYVPGIAGLDDIQTITSLVIMREVAKETAAYETEFIVPCRDPVVLTGAEEAVRTGFMEAGKPDFYKSDNVRFLSDEQFAFTAATNGIMLREKTAANIYIGAFWAESLILAETGFLCGAIQIAGTANVSQLPFFVAACDYTLIGEEIYAASAYLAKEPMLLGSLKGSDWAKVIFAIVIIVGAVGASLILGEDGTKHALWQPYIDFFAGK